MRFTSDDSQNIMNLYKEITNPIVNEEKVVFKESSWVEDDYKIKEYMTYKAWKFAVTRLLPDAEFTGDQDIDSVIGPEDKSIMAEWDGEKGLIYTKEN